jgi:LysM repeat protein
MNRRQLAFLVIVNAIVATVIALGVYALFEMRRPDLEELAALYTPQPGAVLAITPLSPTNDTVTNDTGLTPVPPTTSQDQPVGDAPAPDQPTPDQAASEAPTLTGEEAVYVVKAGDSLLGIATQFRVTVDELVQANELENPDYVFSGQRLVIPTRTSSVVGEPQVTAQPTATPIVEGVEVKAVEAAGDLAGEVVLVVNESNQPFSLEGWRLERENGPAYRFGNVPLFPSGYVRVHSTTGTDTSLDLYWQQPNAVWQSGAVARLLDGQGNVIHTYTVP